LRAAIFHGPGRISIEQIADPQPGPSEMLVKVHRCGVCGSDIAMTGDGPMHLPTGRFGHEWSGEVIEAGRDVEGFRPGDRIAGLPAARCGSCEGCRTGNPLFCEHARYLVGGFGEYMVIPPVAAVRLPNSLSFTDGAMIEPMTCGLHALNFAGMRGGENVLVMGAGAMAMSAVYWARNLGAGKIAVLSRSAYRADVLMELGADVVLGFDEEGQARIVERLGASPDIVFECIGKQGMLALATEHVRLQGAVISLGMCQHGDPIVPVDCSRKEVRLMFPRAYTVGEFEATARAFDGGRIRPEIMVSETISLDDLPDMMAALRAGSRKTLKVHVDPAIG
jgi:threonine dehydrogenase-like Zn-dependent dehydrogenase